MQNFTGPTASAAALGIVGSGIWAGVTAGLSILAMPGILSAQAPARTLAVQWRHIFVHGRAIGPPFSLAALAGFAYVAYDRHSRGLSWQSFVAAGALTISIVPYTLIWLAPTNQKLMDIAAGAGSSAAAAASEETVRALIGKWSTLNFYRACLSLAGSLVGFWALQQA